MPNSNIYNCTESEWHQANVGSYDFYIKDTPVLANFNLPIPFQFLQEFYVADMEDRNLEDYINLSVLNCYDFVFSYFRENYQKPLKNKFLGRTWLEHLVQVFPDALKKSFNDVNNSVFTPIGNLFSFFTNPYILVALILIIFYMFFKIRG